MHSVGTELVVDRVSGEGGLGVGMCDNEFRSHGQSSHGYTHLACRVLPFRRPINSSSGSAAETEALCKTAVEPGGSSPPSPLPLTAKKRVDESTLLVLSSPKFLADFFDFHRVASVLDAVIAELGLGEKLSTVLFHPQASRARQERAQNSYLPQHRTQNSYCSSSTAAAASHQHDERVKKNSPEIESLVHRAPHPTIHILREMDLETARAKFPECGVRVPARNRAKLLSSSCRRKESSSCPSDFREEI